MASPLHRVSLGNRVQPMLEVAKFVGAMFWLFGLVFLFLLPPFGMFILLIAVLISVFTATKTRGRRHNEIVGAVGKIPPAAQPSTSAPPPHSVADRLAELTKLRDTGLVSEEEYQTKRQDILGEV